MHDTSMRFLRDADPGGSGGLISPEQKAQYRADTFKEFYDKHHPLRLKLLKRLLKILTVTTILSLMIVLYRLWMRADNGIQDGVSLVLIGMLSLSAVAFVIVITCIRFCPHSPKERTRILQAIHMDTRMKDIIDEEADRMLAERREALTKVIKDAQGELDDLDSGTFTEAARILVEDDIFFMFDDAF